MNLSEHRISRGFTLCALYMAQGIPYGFVTYLLASYLAEKGLSSDEVGNLTALATLPWAFKWIWGPVIDRFTFRPMGRRRPWILLAQTFMVITITALLFIPDVTRDFQLLCALVFVHNIFAALQDVSVDALAVELLEENERGRMNGLMFGSASLGAAFSGIVLAQVMGAWGLRAAMLVQAIALFGIMMFPLLLRERAGERILPWTAGHASAEGQRASADSMGTLFRLLKRAFSFRTALVMAVLALIVKIAVELHGVVATVFYIQKMGWTKEEFSSVRGYVEGFAVAGCVIGGFLADRIGHKLMASITTILFGAAYVGFALMPDLWESKTAVLLFFGTEGALFGALSVALFAICMNISLPAVAGTQFTAYMAMMNISATLGKKAAGWFDTRMSYSEILIFWGVFQAVAITLLLLVVNPKQRAPEKKSGST